MHLTVVRVSSLESTAGNSKISSGIGPNGKGNSQRPSEHSQDVVRGQ